MERVRIRKLNTVPKTASILNERLIAQFCRLIRKGLPADGACDYLGVSNTTYWSWRTKGQRYLDGGNTPADDKIYGDFMLAFKQATAKYKMSLVKDLHKTRNLNWVRPLAILERRDRKSFGKQALEGGDDEAFSADERFM